MNIDPSLQAAGHQSGVDVDALYKKYSGSAPTQNSASDFSSSAASTSATKLNNIRICKQCHGYGLVKEMYYHQVKEVNCGECAGDGIIKVENK